MAIAMIAEIPGVTQEQIDAARSVAAPGGRPAAGLLYHLSGLDTQQIQDRAGEGSVQIGVPEGVRVVLGRRLARLSNQCRAVLQVAAAFGVEFRVEAVQWVMGLSALPLLERLDEALAARLVREIGVGRYAFSHALVRDAVYGELGLARRVRLHQQAGEALEVLRDRGLAVEPVELAYHFRLAAPGGSGDKAVRYAIEAASRAMVLLAYEDAARLYRQALAVLDLAPAAANRIDLLLALAGAQVAAGNLSEVRRIYEQAATLTGSPCQSERATVPEKPHAWPPAGDVV